MAGGQEPFSTEPKDSVVDDFAKAGIRRQAERIARNCEYSANAQFESSKQLSKWHFVLGVVSTIAATAGGLGILTGNLAWWWSLFALIAGISSFWSTAANHSGRAVRSEISGHDYVRLRNRVDNFVDVDLAGLSIDQAKAELDGFLAEEDRLNVRISLASDKAYTKGKETIEKRR